MNTLLIEPPFYLFQDIKPESASLGLASLASSVSKEGHSVKVFSPDFEMAMKMRGEGTITTRQNVDEKMRMVKKKLDEILHSFKPDVIGLSLWTARAQCGLELARHVKEVDSDMIIVAGGIHATILPDEILKSGVIDFVIKGEGEIFFPALLRRIKENKDPRKEHIPGLSFVSEEGQTINNPLEYCQNLDDLPFPGYEHFVGCEKFDSEAFQSVMFSRGCPFHCNYCASHMLWTRKTRYHSPLYIVRMLKYIHQKFHTRLFRFNDDTFTLNKDYVHEICRLLKQERLPIRWHCDTRAELVSRELLLEMKKAGLTTIAIGVESGDVEMRKRIRKTSTLEETKIAFNVARKAGIHTVGYFMIGFPGETYAQGIKTLELIEELRPTVPCISIFIPYPGTEAFQDAVTLGSIKNVDRIDWSMYYHHSNVNFSGVISDDDWEKLLKKSSEIVKKSTARLMLNGFYLKKIISRYAKNPGTFLDAIFHFYSKPV